MKILYSFLLLIIIVSIFTVTGKTQNESLKLKDPFLNLSLKGIQNYTEHSIQEVRNFFNSSYFLSDQDALQLLEKFNEAGLHLASRLAVLKHIHMLTDDPALIRQGKYGFWKIIRFSLFKDWKSKIYTLIDQLDKEPIFIKSHQRFIFKKLLKNMSKKSLSKRQKENIQKIITSMKEKGNPYTYMQGEEEDKQSNGPFTLLTFNVCFTPKDMPLVFGGMTKWEDRIDKVAQVIKDSNADVVCLQEVFDIQAHEALYNRLRDQYSHFYTHIGPWGFEGSFSTLGFESGLFVASKYPITNPSFISFKDDNPHIHRGVFSFQIQSKDEKTLGKIFTTHLEPFESGKNLRKKELEQILKQMQSEQNNQNPVILCGDLNMLPEESKEWIDTYFIDDFQFKDFTHCDFTSQKWNYSNNDPLKPSQLDYTLLLKTDKHSIHTSLIKTFDVNDLENATSDHHALLTQISQKN